MKVMLVSTLARQTRSNTPNTRSTRGAIAEEIKIVKSYEIELQPVSTMLVGLVNYSLCTLAYL